MTPEQEQEIKQKASTAAIWELIQDLISNITALRAENAVLKKKLDGETAGS